MIGTSMEAIVIYGKGLDFEVGMTGTSFLLGTQICMGVFPISQGIKVLDVITGFDLYCWSLIGHYPIGWIRSVKNHDQQALLILVVDTQVPLEDTVPKLHRVPTLAM
jgi:hypothetical protein